MARRPRLLAPGAVYHVMSRGNRKAAIFDDDTDRHRFLRLVAEAVTRYEIRCFEFCLMGNHYHMLIDTPRGNLSDAMQYINGVYTQRSNRRHDRVGHVFQGRFAATTITRESYLRCAARYIALNPVKAGLVSDPSKWRWSTYRMTIGKTPASGFLSTEWMTTAFECASTMQARRAYRVFVRKGMRKLNIDPRLCSEPPSEAHAEEEILRDEESAKTESSLPRVSRALVRPPLDTLLAIVDPLRSNRDRVIYESHAVHGYRLAEIARHLGVDRSTVSRAVRHHVGAAAEREADWP